jgi:LeuA allosteric (dimerisation) domain.
MVKHKFDVTESHFEQKDGIIASVSIKEGGTVTVVTAKGNGRLNAVNNAIRKHFNTVYHLAEYEEHSLSRNSNAVAICYVGITTDNDDKPVWGVATDEDIITASIHALVNAVNKTMK